MYAVLSRNSSAPLTFPTSEKVTFALYSQADVLLRQGQTARATELLEQLVRDYPMSPAALKAKPKLEELKGPN